MRLTPPRAALAAVAFGTLLAGCQPDSPETSLSLVATNNHVGRATFTLECEPPGGDIGQARAACTRLLRQPSTLLRPTPFTCFGGTFSWWDIRITGRFEGKAVDVRTSTCWTPQMKLIRVLGIAGELERHIDPLSRPAYPGSGIPRSALAEEIVIPAATPGWLIRVARLQARRLGADRPELLEIRLGDPHVITLEGDFVCGTCHGPPGAKPPRGSRALITVDPKTRGVLSFGLRE